jgi:hypothetical protein
VLVEDEKIVAVGTDLPANGAKSVDASGKLIVPVYVRGNLVYRDDEVAGERGSASFIERSFAAPGLEVGI